MYTICPACGTEVTFMVNQCPICARVLNVFDFHRGDSPNTDYSCNPNAPYIYSRAVITYIKEYTITREVEKWNDYFKEYETEYKDEYYVDYTYEYLYHGKSHLGSFTERVRIYTKPYEIGDDIIIRFSYGRNIQEVVCEHRLVEMARRFF